MTAPPSSSTRHARHAHRRPAHGGGDQPGPGRPPGSLPPPPGATSQSVCLPCSALNFSSAAASAVPHVLLRQWLSAKWPALETYSTTHGFPNGYLELCAKQCDEVYLQHTKWRARHARPGAPPTRFGSTPQTNGPWSPTSAPRACGSTVCPGTTSSPDETVILLLHPPLALAGVSIGMERVSAK